MKAVGPDASAKGKRRVIGLSCLLALVTIAVYGRVAAHGFINYDDPDYVTWNPFVQAGLKSSSILWAFRDVSANWHPMTWLSHMLDCQLYGLNPPGHHITSVLLHAANTVLIFVVFRRMTGAVWPNVFLAALFALHPLRVESVAWISERKDVLSAFFGLLTLWAYASYVDKSGLRPGMGQVEAGESSAQIARRSLIPAGSLRSYLLALFFFALGLMSKPMLVTWPLVLLLVDYWPLRRFELSAGRTRPSIIQGLLLEKIPFLLLSAALSIITYHAQQGVGTMHSLAGLPLPARLANATLAYTQYLQTTFWPLNLAVLYPYARMSLVSWQVILAFVILALLSGAAFWAGRKRPYVIVGWLWFVGMLVPVIGLVQVGYAARADRYTYLPQIGLFVILTYAGVEIANRLKRPAPAVTAAFGLILGMCALLTSRQLGFWRDTLTLFQHATRVTSGNFVAHGIVASELIQRNRLSEAFENCEKALAILPGYSAAHGSLGGIYLQKGFTNEAIASYRRAIECDPASADSYYALGELYSTIKDYPQAEANFRETLRRSPVHLPALLALGGALHREGKLGEAAEVYQRILKMDPHHAVAHRSLGNVQLARGNNEDAQREYWRALENAPDDALAHAALGVVLLKKQQVAEAATQFLETIRLQPTNAVANIQLALIYQGQNDLVQAARFYRLVLQSEPGTLAALNNLAWILAVHPDPQLRNGAEAMSLAERACRLTDFTNATFLGTLAAARAEAGKFAEAQDAAEKSQALALAAGQPALAERSRQLLELFRAGRPFHLGQ